VIGSSGKDTLTGNNSDNRLAGGGGDDTINGGGGDDTIVGGTETDIEALTGGAGRDTFLYLSRADSFTNAKHTGDIITDFNTDQDLIDLRALNVNVNNLRLDDTGVGSTNREGHLYEDLNNNGTFDSNELNINIVLSGSHEFSLLDVLV
jgi:Ca2+-binding RTX toxin-like protein